MFLRSHFWHKKSIRISAVLLAFVFVATMFLGSFFVSADLYQTSDSVRCPLMTGETVVCQMDGGELLSAWQSKFLTIIPTLLTLLLAASLVAVSALLPTTPFQQLCKVWELAPICTYSERPLTFAVRSLQELFSSGILHPKLYNVRLN